MIDLDIECILVFINIGQWLIFKFDYQSVVFVYQSILVKVKYFFVIFQ